MYRSKMKKIFVVLFLTVFFVEVNASLIETANFGSYGFPTVKKMPNGMGYAVGGNFFMKLNTQHMNKPLLALTPPSVNMGCGGLSIKGMFMSILGLDDLQALLSNAGATIAWGIMLGLIETLPSISQTFTQIREFVRRLQALLSQGCALGKEIALKTPIFKKVGDKIKSAMGGINKTDSYFAKKIKKWRGSIPKTFAGLLSGSNVPDSKKQDMIIGVVMQGFAPAHGTWSRYIYSYAHDYGKDLDTFINTITSGGHTTTAGNYSYTISDEQPLPFDKMSPDFKLQAGLIILLQNYGMLDTNVLSSNALPSFLNIANGLAKALKSSNPTTAKQALAAEMKVFSTDKNTKGDAVVQRYFSREAEPKSMSELASFFQNGTNKLKSVAVPEFVSLEVKKGGQTVTSILAAVDQNTIVTSGGWLDYINTFGDSDNIAKAQVACLTRGTTPTVTITSKVSKKIGGKTTIIPLSKSYTCSNLPPIILPEARRMLRIYAQSSPATQVALKNAVAQQESVYITESIMGALNEVKALIFGKNTKDMIPTVGSDHATDTNSTTTFSGDSLNNTNDNTVNSAKIVLGSINKALKALRKQLDYKLEKLHSVGPYGNFSKYLNSINQRNHQNAVRNLE